MAHVGFHSSISRIRLLSYKWQSSKTDERPTDQSPSPVLQYISVSWSLRPARIKLTRISWLMLQSRRNGTGRLSHPQGLTQSGALTTVMYQGLGPGLSASSTTLMSGPNHVSLQGKLHNPVRKPPSIATL